MNTMEDSTKRLNERFETLRKMLVTRASMALGEAGLKSFLALLEDYHGELTAVLKYCDSQRDGVKDENSLLLGLVGLNDTELRAKLIAQAEEIRFLRQSVLDLRKEGEKQVKNGEARELELERFKSELDKSFKDRERDQKDFTVRVDDLEKRLKEYQDKISRREAEISARNMEIDLKLATVNGEIDIKSEEAVKRAVVRLNNICKEINEASTVFAGEMASMKTKLAAKKGVGFKIFGGGSELKDIFAAVMPSFNLLNDKVEEVVGILGKYMDVFAVSDVKPAKVNWKKVFDDLKGRFSVQASSKRIKIIWPAAKMPVNFVSDQAMLVKAFSAVIVNSLEALPVEGSVEVELNFTPSGAELLVSDSGKEIKPENKELLFTPLFTTKSSHYGLGLVTCRRIMKNLGGTVVYDNSKGGNGFRLNLPALKEPPQKGK